MWKTKKRKNKYGNKKCVVDGHTFDSRKEMLRYHELKALETIGEISQLQVHPKYVLSKGTAFSLVIRGDKRISKTGRNTKVTYEPDFQYLDEKTGKIVIEDVKSIPTAKKYDFKLKRAIFEALFETEVTVIL